MPKHKKVCKHGECTRPARSLGYCFMHYNRHKRGKDMDAPVQRVFKKRRRRYRRRLRKEVVREIFSLNTERLKLVASLMDVSYEDFLRMAAVEWFRINGAER